jgi:NitT/TauT family transport system permease protein
LSVGTMITLWELAAALDLVNPVILPPPSVFVTEIQHQAQFLLPQIGVQRIGGNFVALTAIWASLVRILSGLALAFVAAVLVGSLAFSLGVFHKLTYPVIRLLAPIAPVAWIPFALVAFGIGDGAAIFVVFVGIFFVLELAAVNCMKNVDQHYIDTARVLGASRRQVMWHVIFPAILPNLFVIMRVNLFGAWMGVLTAEMVGVNTGLGTIVLVGRQMMNMNLTFLGMAMIGLVGYLLDAGLAVLQRRVLWWRSAAQV